MSNDLTQQNKPPASRVFSDKIAGITRKTARFSVQYYHGALYNKYGRFVLSFSIFAGAAFSLFVSLPYYLVVIIEALITGALLVNIIKFELPNEGEGSIRGLLVGTICSGILFVFV